MDDLTPQEVADLGHVVQIMYEICQEEVRERSAGKETAA